MSSELRRRLIYFMAFRVLLITLVLGTTTLIYWLGDLDLRQSGPLLLYGIIGSTYVLTLIYASILGRTEAKQKASLDTIVNWQILGDLVIATSIVHATGGVQSAYTFFFPLAVIGSALVKNRQGAILVALGATLLFLGVSYVGWYGIWEVSNAQNYHPSEISTLAFGQSIGLNIAAIAGVGIMAIQLAAQLQKSSISIEAHRSVTADLLTLHQDTIRSLTSGLITIDKNSIVQSINKAATEIMGITFQETTAGTEIAKYNQELADLLTSFPISEEARRGEISHQKQDGEFLILGVSISPLVDHASNIVGRIINFQDLTEVRALEEKYKRAERLSVIGTLAAGIAHEIRNPLASISGSIELLGRSPSSDEESKPLMNIVTREIERLNLLITDFLAYASPRPLRLKTVDLNLLITETLIVFEQSKKFPDVKATFTPHSMSKATVHGDPEQLRQLLWNLLSNGEEAASQGGKQLWISISNADKNVLLRVRDNGPGIPEEQKNKIFDPFFTTKEHGTGLGLAMVHSTVVDHNGNIEVVSNTGQGTTFTISLPYHQPHDS